MANSGKTLQTRIQLKHDTNANWTTAGNNGFIPLAGEVIVYDDLGPKVKIGNGTTNVNDLSWVALTPQEVNNGLALKVSKAGDTMGGELIFNGGDKSGGSKIVLETGKGQITNSGTQTLFGFTAASTIAVGHSSYILAMRGSGSKPKYNSKDIALQEDVDAKVAKAGDIMTGRLQINMSNPHIHMKDTEYSTDWYFQAHQDQLAFGPTFATAVKTDKNGNMTVPGTVTVGNKVTMQYNSSTESLDFTFA